MSDYVRTFEARGALYNQATALCPEARATERRHVLDLLECRSGDTVCDVLAGGGYLAVGLARVVGAAGTVLCLEPSATFAAGILAGLPRVLAAPDALALLDESIDHAGSLAALHHLDSKQSLIEEVYRVVRPGGRFAVAEALTGSPVARFLNGAVDRLTETGHQGRFVARGELVARLERAGFVDVRELYRELTWNFADRETLERYCHELFGMVRADRAEVARVLADELGVETDETGAHLSWSLMYAVGTKPA